MDEKERYIQLNEDFRVCQDRHNVWIEELTISEKTKRKSWNRVTGYFMNYRDAFDDFAGMKFRKDGAKSAAAHLKKMAEAEEETIKLIHSLLDAI